MMGAGQQLVVEERPSINSCLPIKRNNGNMRSHLHILINFLLLICVLYTSFAVSPPPAPVTSNRVLRKGNVVGKVKTFREERGVRATDIPKAIAIHEW